MRLWEVNILVCTVGCADCYSVVVFDRKRDKGGYQQKLYFDTYQRISVKAVEPLTGNIGVYTTFCSGADFCVAPSGKIVNILMLPSTKQKKLALNVKCF